MVAGSIIIFLAQIESKLAFTHDKFWVKIEVLLVLPITSNSIFVVTGPPIPIGCVKYNGLLSAFGIVVTLLACVPA